MQAPTLIVGLVALSIVSPVAWADTVEMRDGTLINGKYVGGTAATVRVETPDGVKVVETSQVLALTFGATASAATPTTTPTAAAPAGVPAAAQQVAPAPAAAAAPAPITLPA